MNSKEAAEQILKKWLSKEHFTSGLQHINDAPKMFILSAMNEYRSIGEREAAIGFATWMEDSNFYRSEVNGIRYYHKSREEKYTKEQLFEIYKQSL